MQREQFHPAGIDPGECLVGARQAGDGPVKALGPARDRDAGGGVGAENGEDVIGLRLSQELLEARREFEALF